MSDMTREELFSPKGHSVFLRLAGTGMIRTLFIILLLYSVGVARKRLYCLYKYILLLSLKAKSINRKMNNQSCPGAR